MTDRPQSLKAQNAWLIRAALILHGIAFVYVAFEPFVLAQLSGPDALEKLKTALAPGSLSLAIIVLAKLVLLGLIQARLRDRVIHWRWRYPLPGSRAFTRIGRADARVDMARLEQRYGPLPTQPGEQDRLFYKVYRAHADEVGVLDAHKSYLAARDIGIINLILFILLPGFAWWATGNPERVAVYSAALFASYVLMALAAQVYAGRFVENVLATASSPSGQV
ncbi:MAG TPA: hypothetical protein VF194_09185 [Ferrovibrio sp.]|jgi:hypothetical protein|uniref:hypothetical protein n=1 Tax=Ferrovibrio sp. TaxID=1917215 RepID=UPI002ED41149